MTSARRGCTPTVSVNERLARSRAEYARRVQNGNRATSTVFGVLPTIPALPSLSIVSSISAVEQQSNANISGGDDDDDGSALRLPDDLLSTSPVATSFRSDLLSFIFSHLPTPYDVTAPLNLVDLCLLSLVIPEFDEGGVSLLPPHLQFRLARLAAINRPFSQSELIPCWGEDFSGSGGEVVVIGRDAAAAARGLLARLKEPLSEPEEGWDTPLHLSVGSQTPALHTFILVGAHMPPLSLLPPSITHLALLFVSFDAIKLARNLPGAVPLLQWLDISGCAHTGLKWVSTVPWRKWAFLQGVRIRPKPTVNEAFRAKVSEVINEHSASEVQVFL